MSLPRAIAFVATARPNQALSFYRDTLGFTLLDNTESAFVFDAFGTLLRLQKIARMQAAPYTVFGLEVANIREEARRLAGLGIAAERYPHFQQDDDGIWNAPSGAKVFWFRDPDANLLSLSES